jgi:signal transduction histidine kinase
MASSLVPEVLVPRLGEYLVRKGVISEPDLKVALEYQQMKKRSGEHCLLGQSLIDLNLLDREQLDQSVTEQIIQLRSALEEVNRSLEKRVAERTSELQEALRKLSELSQLKANFVANVSHELRTPLTHIKGYLELLSVEALGPLSDEQKSALQVSNRAASRLENLIDNLILFSLAARGEMMLHLAPVNLSKIAEEILLLSQAKADDKNVQLAIEIPPDLPNVQADKEKISWVILQLIDNSIKFTHEGGTITLNIRPETDTIIMVTVCDTGIGIPVEKQSEIFEAFHQLDSSSTRRYGGTGLGLALVHEIVTAHGSIIEVQSEGGKGTCFRFPLLAVK